MTGWLDVVIRHSESIMRPKCLKGSCAGESWESSLELPGRRAQTQGRGYKWTQDLLTADLLVCTVLQSQSRPDQKTFPATAAYKAHVRANAQWHAVYFSLAITKGNEHFQHHTAFGCFATDQYAKSCPIKEPTGFILQHSEYFGSLWFHGIRPIAATVF